MRVLFVIRSLDIGGAERQLVELVRDIDRSRFEISVATFYDGGYLRPQLERLEGVKVFSLGKRARWDLIFLLWRLWKLIRIIKPDIIHSYLDTANLLCLVGGGLQGVPVLWGIRSAFVDFSDYRWTDALLYKLSVWLSQFAAGIIVNSEAGKIYHVAKGYDSRKIYVVANGINTQNYYPDREAGKKVRAEWGVSDDEKLVGMVARLDAIKDHPTFLRAAALLKNMGDQARFVCVGEGTPQFQKFLVDLAASLEISNRLIWVGGRTDMRAVYCALDVLASSSYGEGFSNVIGEAMACGVPCAVTDVGDSVRIIGETGRKAPARDPQALATAIHSLLVLPVEEWNELAESARRRIQDEFSCSMMVTRTEDTLVHLAGIQ